VEVAARGALLGLLLVLAGVLAAARRQQLRLQQQLKETARGSCNSALQLGWL
jgi:hypothetical protein